jgi:hypothetical protein
MSWTGKCGDCGQAALHENIYGLANITDQSVDALDGRMVRERWRRGIAAGIGIRLDELPSRD